MALANFGLDFNEKSLSDEDEDQEHIVNKTKKTNSISNDAKTKFEVLKQKRQRIKKKQERKLLRINKVTEKVAVQDISISNNQQTSSKSLNHEISVFPTDVKDIQRLEYKIDQAIREGNFELAEVVSDRLHVKECEVQMSKTLQTEKFKKAKKRDTKKKRFFWRFEAKKHWESKANM